MQTFKKVIYILFIVGVAGLLVACIAFAQIQNKERVCSAIQVVFDDKEPIEFLKEKEIIKKIKYIADSDIIGEPLSSLDFRKIENEILKSSYVANCKIFSNQKDELVIHLTQKKPILRVINNNGVSYYLSESNDKMPLSVNFTPNVPLAIGEVEMLRKNNGDSIVLYQLFLLATSIQKDSVLDAMIDHVSVNENGDFDLYPKFGKHVIVFGKVDENMPTKWRNLKVFYKEVLTKIGWEKYEQINLNFKDQLVATKKTEIENEKNEK